MIRVTIRRPQEYFRISLGKFRGQFISLLATRDPGTWINSRRDLLLHHGWLLGKTAKFVSDSRISFREFEIFKWDWISIEDSIFFEQGHLEARSRVGMFFDWIDASARERFFGEIL